MARTPRDESVQTALRLPRALHDKLKAAGGERGISEEIRQRLEASFASPTQAADPATAELLEDIAGIAHTLEFDVSGWTADLWTFEAFRAAIETLLEAHRPKSTLKVVRMLFPTTDDSQVVGRTLAANKLKERKKRQEK